MATPALTRSTPQPKVPPPAARQASGAKTQGNPLVPNTDAGNQAAYRTLAESAKVPVKDPAAVPTSTAPATIAGGGTSKMKLPPLSPRARQEMVDDIEKIVAIMKTQYVYESEEKEINGILAKYSARDRGVRPPLGETLSPNLDHFLILMKSRAFPRSSVKSLGQDQYAILYDAIWYRFGDEAIDEFKNLVARSQTQKTAGPGDKDVENGAALIAKQEAMGMWGMLKGLGTGLVGIAGPTVSQAMAEQFDEAARELFGHEWDNSEPLVWGMNAGQIGTAGGDVIWQLVTFAKSAGAKGGKILELANRLKDITDKAQAVIAVSGGLQGVYLSATGIARIIEEKQKAGITITAKELMNDGPFVDQLVTLMSSVINTTIAVKGAKVAPLTRRRVQLLLAGAQISASVSHLATIAASNKSDLEKELEYGQVVASLISQLVSAALDVKGYADDKKAQRSSPKTTPRDEQTPEPDAAPQKDAPPQARKVASTPPVEEQPAPKDAPKPKATATAASESEADAKKPKLAPSGKKADEEGPVAGKRPADAIHSPDDLPNVLLIGVTDSQLRLVLREVEQAGPIGKEIADRIKSGQLHMTLDANRVSETAVGLAQPKEIHVTWGSSVEDTVSILIHEGVHHGDVSLWKGGPRTEAEALARVPQFEYRSQKKLPPSDHVEELYRLVLEKEQKAGASREAALETARQAMIDMMQRDPKLFGVEPASPEPRKTGAAVKPVTGPAKSAVQTKSQPRPEATTETSDQPKAKKDAPTATDEKVMEQLGEFVAPADFHIPLIDPATLPKLPANVKKTIGKTGATAADVAGATSEPGTAAKRRMPRLPSEDERAKAASVKKTIGKTGATAADVAAATAEPDQSPTPRKQSQRVLNEDERIKAAGAKARLEEEIQRGKQRMKSNRTPAEEDARLKELIANPKQAPADLKDEVARLPKDDPEERIEAIRELLEKPGLSPDAVEYLKWQEELQDLRQAARDRADANAKLGNNQTGLEERVPDAVAALRQASKSIKQLMRLVGPNYRKASNIGFDQVLEEARFKQLPPNEKQLQTDHLVPLDWVANSSEMTEFLKVYASASKAEQQAMGQALIDLGDIPDNLVRMRADANNFKSAKAWKDMTPAEVKKFGYEKDDYDRMVKREAAMLTDIKAQILALANEYKQP